MSQSVSLNHSCSAVCTFFFFFLIFDAWLFLGKGKCQFHSAESKMYLWSLLCVFLFEFVAGFCFFDLFFFNGTMS